MFALCVIIVGVRCVYVLGVCAKWVAKMVDRKSVVEGKWVDFGSRPSAQNDNSYSPPL